MEQGPWLFLQQNYSQVSRYGGRTVPCAHGNSYQAVSANMACQSGNFAIADLDRKADYGPPNGLCIDPREAQFDRRAERENPGSTRRPVRPVT